MCTQVSEWLSYCQVHVLSGDSTIASFPALCPPSKLEGCSRVAATNPSNTGCGPAAAAARQRA